MGAVVVAATVEVMRAGFISPSAWYSPTVPVTYRNSHFVTLDSTRIEQVVTIDHELVPFAVRVPHRSGHRAASRLPFGVIAARRV